MRDKEARKVIQKMAKKLGGEVNFWSYFTADAYIPDISSSIKNLDDFGMRQRQYFTEFRGLIADLDSRVAAMERAAKPTCKKCGQKVESVKRTGANDV